MRASHGRTEKYYFGKNYFMKINRLVHPGFWFGKTPLEDAVELAAMGVGGFCVYGGTTKSVAELTELLRKASPYTELLISADYEDGLGRWLPDAALFPSNMAIGASASEELSFEKARLTALQAKQLGINWVLAPVIDLADNPGNPIVNTRAFSDRPDSVTTLARAFLDGLKAGGVLNTLKHFPGHGDTTTDSHLALPIVRRNQTQLQNKELQPFKKLISKADSVLTGHLLMPAFDPMFPASQSRKITTDLLKTELGFNGCVVTDALCMKAIGDERTAALNALKAGAHVLLAPENPFELIAFLNEQEGTEPYIQESFRLQSNLILRLQEFLPSPSGYPFEDTSFNRKCASACCVFRGNWEGLLPGDTVHYVELGNDENYFATSFLSTLKNSGVRVHPFENRAEKLIIASFSNYKSFKGKINLSSAEKETLARAVANSGKNIFISFGNPFSTNGFEDKVNAALFTFSPNAEFQKYAAEVLLGHKQPAGKMPVLL